MRPRFAARILCLLLIATGLSIGRERSTPIDREAGKEERYRVVSGQDCNFEKDPDSYLFGLRKHIEAISVRTDRFAAQTGDRNAPVSDEKYSIFVNDVPRRSYIDNYIFDKMQADNVPHAPLSSDAEFLRRVSLDLTGRIPSPDAIREFLNDESSQKRSNLVRTLIGSAGYTSKWTMYFGDLFRNNANDSFVNRYPEGRNAFYWSIRSFVEGNVPYDVFVRKLLTATGNSFAEGEANWAVGSRTPMGPVQDTYDTLAVRAATQFLGLSTLDCLMCHSGSGHLDKLNVWASKSTRTQAWEMSAFFSRSRLTVVTLTQNPLLQYYNVTDVTTGDYPLNTTAGNRTPRQAVGGVNAIRPRYISNGVQATGSNYRQAFADNLVADRQFARATVNYLWKELMGMGIVEPADQFDPARLESAPSGWTLQPSHPELLEALTDDFIRSGYDLRAMITTIADSSAYQLSSRFSGTWKDEYTPYFARKFVRRLDAEEVHDAITTATRVPGSYTLPNMPNVVWAMDLPDTLEPRSNGGVATFLNYFLRGNRDTNLRSDEGTILQSLNMMNNNFVVNRIRNNTVANTSVARVLANKNFSDANVVEELFLSTLGRFPTAKELSLATAALKANRIAGTEDLQWTLLNKVDFLYNY